MYDWGFIKCFSSDAVSIFFLLMLKVKDV